MAIAIAGCSKSDPSTPRYWEKQLDSKKAGEALDRIGDELKTDAQREWGAKLVLKYFDKNPEKASRAIGKLHFADAAIIDRLISALQTNDPSLMSKAADALGGVMGRKATPELIRILETWVPKNPKDLTPVRQAVTKALGAFQAREAVPALMKMAVDRSHALIVNLKAIEALADIGDPRSTSALIQALYLGCPEDKCSAAARIGLNRIGRTAVPSLLRVVRRQDPAIEKLAREKKLSEGTVTAVPFLVLGDVGDSQLARQLIQEFLKSGESFTRVNAISAIGYTGSPDVATDLIRAYDKALLEARTNILHALHRIGDKRSVPFLLKVLKKREDPNLMWTAGLALSYLGGEAELPAVDAVLKRLKTELPKMAGEDAAITKQGILYFSDFAARLRAAKGCNGEACWRERLKSPEKQVRIKAARMLAFSQAKGASEDALVAAAGDPEPEVREEIAFALSRVGNIKSIAELEKRCREDQTKTGLKGSLLLYSIVAARLKSRSGA
jgi:HEAT repeat protein